MEVTSVPAKGRRDVFGTIAPQLALNNVVELIPVRAPRKLDALGMKAQLALSSAVQKLNVPAILRKRKDVFGIPGLRLALFWTRKWFQPCPFF